MRKILLISLILFTFNVNAQIVNDSLFAFVAYWKQNEIINFKISNQKFDIQKGDTTFIEKYSYDAKVIVLEDTDNGYKLKWTNSNFQFDLGNPLMNRLNAIVTSVPFIYETDELGVFKKIVNLDEIKGMIDQALMLVTMEFGTEPETLRLMEQVRRKYSSEEAMKLYGITDILQFHSPFGAVLKKDTVFEAVTPILNIYGGAPFNANCEMKIAYFDQESHSVMVQNIMEVDPKEATLASYEYLKRMLKATNEPIPDLEDMPQVKITQRFASNVFIDKGRVLYSIFMRLVQVGSDQTSVERRDIRFQR